MLLIEKTLPANGCGFTDYFIPKRSIILYIHSKTRMIMIIIIIIMNYAENYLVWDLTKQPSSDMKGEMIEPDPYIIADQFLCCQTSVLDQTISQSRDDNILVHIS